MLRQTKAWQIREAICLEQVSSFIGIYPSVSAVAVKQDKTSGEIFGEIQPNQVISFFEKNENNDLVILTPWSASKSNVINYANNHGDIILDSVENSSSSHIDFDVKKMIWTATLDLSWDIFIGGFLSYLNLGSKITVKKSTNTKDYVAINRREYLATKVWCYLAAIINSNLTQVSAERFLSYIERYKV